MLTKAEVDEIRTSAITEPGEWWSDRMLALLDTIDELEAAIKEIAECNSINSCSECIGQALQALTKLEGK